MPLTIRHRKAEEVTPSSTDRSSAEFNQIKLELARLQPGMGAGGGRWEPEGAPQDEGDADPCGQANRSDRGARAAGSLSQRSVTSARCGDGSSGFGFVRTQGAPPIPAS